MEEEMEEEARRKLRLRNKKNLKIIFMSIKINYLD